ncbi:hypothetical protein F2P56_019971 [Juglans regia]|uniref:Transmembrane protein n=2 Tax=Juglans regia TaxID=51240 RepID=A0A833X4N6_JUGRE|nr:uncharacterized protein LOC108994288 isoform X2 [Juglans regia]KAF5460074.1 hypothetical protein F2P56_019971 [Juglans regia]
MADWGPVIVAVLLFVLLSPGLLFQMPAKGRVVEFGNMQTSGASILVHAIIYFGLITIFVIAIGVHIYTDKLYEADEVGVQSVVFDFASFLQASFNFRSMIG